MSLTKCAQNGSQNEIKAKEQNSQHKVECLIDNIKNEWKAKLPNLKKAELIIKELDEYEQGLFEKSDLFNSNYNESRIHLYFKKAKSKHHNFLAFIINSQYIETVINELSIDGKTLIQTLFENKYLEHKENWIMKITIAGYKFQLMDFELFDKLYLKKQDIEALILLCKLSESIVNPHL